MKKKRLIFLVSNDLNYDQRMKRICSTLHENEYRCLLVGRQKKNSLPLTIEDFEQKRLRLLFSRGVLFYAFLNIRLFLFLLFRPFSAVCAIDLDTLPAAWLISRIRRRPLIFDSHEYFTEVPELAEGSIQKTTWKAIAQVLIPRINHAYTVNQSLAELFKEKYGTAFEVIHNFPTKISNLEKGNNVVPIDNFLSAKKIILYQGALNQGRGIEHCILAMRHIEDCILYIAGEGDLSDELRAMVDYYELNDKVRFLGYLKPETLRQVTGIAWLGINVLDHQSLNYYYSLANKFFDYVNANVPSISMNFPEYKRYNSIREVSYLLETLDQKLLADAIIHLQTNTALYSRLKTNCAKLSVQFNWEKESEKLIHFYNKVLTD